MSLTHINKANLREATLNPGFREKSTNAVNGKRTNHNISFHRNEFVEKEEIVIDVPRLSSEGILVQDSLNFCFNLDLGNNTKSWFKNNLSKLLQDRLEVSMEGQKFLRTQKKVCLKSIKTIGCQMKFAKIPSNMVLQIPIRES